MTSERLTNPYHPATLEPPTNRPPKQECIENACLLVVRSSTPQQHGERIPLDQPSFTIGRSQASDIVLQDPHVSMRHATVERVEEGWRLADLGSTNGTACNGQRLTEPRVLRCHDRITFGFTILKFLAGEEIDGLLRSEFDRLAHDRLTRLPGRRLIEEWLATEIADTAVTGAALSVATLEVDHLGRINADHGMDVGDGVLKELVRTTQEQLTSLQSREPAILGRLDSDKFCIVLRRTPLDGATALCEGLRQTVESAPFRFGELEVNVTIRGGCAQSASANQSAADLLCLTEQCRALAREQGRNRVVRADMLPASRGPDELRLLSRIQTEPQFWRELEQPRPVNRTKSTAPARPSGAGTTQEFSIFLPTYIVAASVAGRSAVAAEDPTVAPALDDLVRLACAEVVPATAVLGEMKDGVVMAAVRDESRSYRALLPRLSEAFEERRRCVLPGTAARMAVGGAQIAVNLPLRMVAAAAVSQMETNATRAARVDRSPLPIGCARRSLEAKLVPDAQFLGLELLVDHTLRYLTALAVADLARLEGNAFRTTELALSMKRWFAARLALGTWAQACRASLVMLAGRTADVTFPELLAQLITPKRKPTEALEPLLSFTEVRNKYTHHKLPPAEVPKVVAEWRPRLEEALDTIPALSDVVPCVVGEVDFPGDSPEEPIAYRAYVLGGDNPVVRPTELRSRARMAKRRVYALAANRQRALCLEPLVVAADRADAAPDLCLLESLAEGRPLYQSVTTNLDVALPEPATAKQVDLLMRIGLL